MSPALAFPGSANVSGWLSREIHEQTDLQQLVKYQRDFTSQGAAEVVVS
jgi:hypothetical protein